MRVLLTGDVASEGVNMHRQCHHLIHYDLPWSLIRIEQRNGRIDRYGQEHQPEFAALILTSQTDGAKDDTTVAEKLLHREEQAHHSLGTAEGITREFTARKEEDRLVKDLLAGKTVDESIDAANAVDDFLADLLAGVGDQPDAAEPPRADVPELFTSTEAFAREALGFACPALHVDDDGEMLAFAPPDDLVQRLAVLPPNYLKKHNVAERMKVTFDRQAGAAQAGRGPEDQDAVAGHRLPQRPAPDDRVAHRQGAAPHHPPAGPGAHRGRRRAGLPRPGRVLERARPAHRRGVDGGHRAAGRAAGGRPHRARSGRPASGPDMVNTLRFGDIARLQELVPAAVRAARAHLEERREDYDRKVDEPLNEYRERVDGVAAGQPARRPGPVPRPPRAAGRDDRRRAERHDHEAAHGR